MYQNAAILALFGLVFVAFSGWIGRSWLSGPIVFVGGGFLLGPAALGILDPNVTAEGLRVMAELTLAMVLFSDAAKADLARIRRSLGLPERLLLIGLPLTILAGLATAWLLFPTIGLVEMALLAAILAPTDAALGEPVVTNQAVPADLREALNVESGLNDGICVPVVLLLIGLAIGTEIEGEPTTQVLRVFAEEIGIGAVIGGGLAFLASLLLPRATSRRWIAADWRDMALVALAIACFTTAQWLGGSGFIACFTGGIVYNLRQGKDHELMRGIESTGDGLALLTWTIFGAGVVAQTLGAITLTSIIYAVLSLTLVRMLPVFLALTGTTVTPRDRLFVGWFGPRGLASIVFAIMILDADLPNSATLEATIGCTIVLSVIAHGITANPLVKRSARRWRRDR